MPLRCCRGSVLAAALLQGVCACRCAASALAVSGLRKSLDRQRARPRFRVSGSGLGLWVAHDSSLLRSCATVLRLRGPSVDLPPSERSTGGRSTAGGVRCGNDASFSWTVPREGRISRPPNAKGTHDSSSTRRRSNASALATGSRSQRRSLDPQTHERRILRPPRAPNRSPRPQTSAPARRPVEAPFGDHPQREPRQRSSRSRSPAAAQRRRRDSQRQRSSKVTATAGSAAAGRDQPQAAQQQDEPPAALLLPPTAPTRSGRARCARRGAARRGGR